MSGSPRAGVFVYAKNLERLSGFYESVLYMTRAHSTADIVVLRSPDLQITINAIPAHIAEHIELSTPPAHRDNVAYKFFYTVDSLSAARELVSSLGGQMLPEPYRGPGFVVHNVVDPEGNIFQLREMVP